VKEIGWYEYGGLKFRDEPARDACFHVVRRETEMTTYEGMGEPARREAVHRHMANEITSLDIAAQCLAEFPEAPWGLRLELARQCWDEARHIEGLHRRLVEQGGAKGDFPISAFEWNVTCAIDSLAGRLASQNRTFEAGAMDVVGGNIAGWRQAGDDATADVLDAILADEIQHVRFANRWLKALVRQDQRVLLKIAQAVRFVAEANAVLTAGDGGREAMGQARARATALAPAVNVEDRRLAEFTDEEIGEILKQAGFRSLIADAV
jgi:uncharacterized ferritin-like protein (DUF455 family)